MYTALGSLFVVLLFTLHVLKRSHSDEVVIQHRAILHRFNKLSVLPARASSQSRLACSRTSSSTPCRGVTSIAITCLANRSIFRWPHFALRPTSISDHKKYICLFFPPILLLSNSTVHSNKPTNSWSVLQIHTGVNILFDISIGSFGLNQNFEFQMLKFCPPI